MVRHRIPLIACALGALWLGACSSSAKPSSKSNTATTTTTTPAVGGITPIPTTTAAPPVITQASTAAATTTTAAKTTASSSSGATTTTTVKGRVVTSPSDNVKLGDTGKGVEQIQTALKQAGYKVTVDGKFGPQTDTAVRAFQKKSGLTVDGVVGPKTWAKLSGSSTTGNASSTTAAGATSTTKA